MVNEKVLPSPRVESTQIRPPCFSMARLQRARPTPVPGSASPTRRWKRRKICWR
jgi:hypothetical protein